MTITKPSLLNNIIKQYTKIAIKDLCNQLLFAQLTLLPRYLIKDEGFANAILPKLSLNLGLRL